MHDEVKDVEQATPSSVAQKEVRNAVSNFAGILAVVGAFAAIVQIYQAFNRDAPVLQADIRNSVSFIPAGAKVQLDDGHRNIWNISKNDAIKHYCLAKQEDGKVNLFKDERNCAAIKAIVSNIDASVSIPSDVVARSEINLKNTGKDSATNLKIRSKVSGHIKVFDQADKVVLERQVSNGDAIPLPNLNPSEALKVNIDTSLVGDVTDIPTPSITYSRGAVPISEYRYVSPFFADLADFVSGIPLVVVILIFIFVSFVVTLSIMVIALAANALIKGKPLSSIFDD